MTPCGNCGTTWTHTDRVGCCTDCHRAFAGLKAFERHQVGPRDEHGRRACIDPESAVYPPGSPRYPDKVFVDSDARAGGEKGHLWALAPSDADLARLNRLKERTT